MIPFSSIMEENGKTIRENNMREKHQIPIGALVEVKCDRWFGDGACCLIHGRFWVVIHGRDCDGTPLYWVSRVPKHQWQPIYMEIDCWAPEDKTAQSIFYDVLGGFEEKDLTVVEVTKELRDGVGQLQWEE